jgi:hypothetical protein
MELTAAQQRLKDMLYSSHTHKSMQEELDEEEDVEVGDNMGKMDDPDDEDEKGTSFTLADVVRISRSLKKIRKSGRGN